MRKPMVAGNWKMNGLRANLAEVAAIDQAAAKANCDVILCVPATLILQLALKTKSIFIGGQTCHNETSGAHTGDISAEMLQDSGAQYVILGHSERRIDHAETDKSIQQKVLMAWQFGLNAIVCIGENLDQRNSKITLDIIGKQLLNSIPDSVPSEKLVIAYEPIWAIGTGLTPTTDQISEVHNFIRVSLEHRFGDQLGHSINILYGGSMNGKNVAEISAIPDVDGGLVGGASLKAKDFTPIIESIG